MSALFWGTLRRPSAAPARQRPPFARTAPHIRGRVFVMRPATRRMATLYGLEVRNTRTGKVLVTDNCTSLASIVDECHEATAAARAAWFFTFRQKDVR